MPGTTPDGEPARVPRRRARGARTGASPRVVAAALAAAAVVTIAAWRRPGWAATPANPSVREPRPDLDGLDQYIRSAWTTLTRSPRDLAAAARDPKIESEADRETSRAIHPAGGRPGHLVLYVSRHEDLAAVRARITAGWPPAETQRLDLRRLPRPGDPVAEPGLLYLPRPYVVPGGRFNEMYGWDSYFILRGLLRDGLFDRALDLVDDALYEVVHFGKVLNANRTYFLTRSQPPFLSMMVRDVFAVTHDRGWLASTLPALRKQYAYWTKAPHLAGDTGLSRYHALGAGPAPEVVAGERDAHGRTHYDRVRAAFTAGAASSRPEARLYDQRSGRLTPLAYLADRTVRESGFDTSDRFGPFSLDILDYAPVGLNSLLYAMELDIAAILDEVGSVGGSGPWRKAAARRAERIRALMWDEDRGLFFDYDFVHQRRSSYTYATTFFPLWVGLATSEQARQLVRAGLPPLLRPGGLVMSTRITGQQWDAPFGWAPLQLVAFEGLRRYGFEEEADRVAVRFVGTVLRVFAARHAVFEKYDVERRTADVENALAFGYGSNEIGFGWTNGVVRVLEDSLGPAWRGAIVAAAQDRPISAAAP